MFSPLPLPSTGLGRMKKPEKKIDQLSQAIDLCFGDKTSELRQQGKTLELEAERCLNDEGHQTFWGV